VTLETLRDVRWCNQPRARVARLIFAAEDQKGGAVLHGPAFLEQSTCHHRPTVGRAVTPTQRVNYCDHSSD